MKKNILLILILCFIVSSCWKSGDEDIVFDVDEKALITEVEVVSEESTLEPVTEIIEDKKAETSEVKEEIETQAVEVINEAEPEEVPEGQIKLIAKKVSAQSTPTQTTQTTADQPITSSVSPPPIVPGYQRPAPVNQEPYEAPGAMESVGDFFWHLAHPFSKRSEYDKRQKKNSS